ncbi:outer membrane protein assembly factor BamC [Hydrogenophaga sp. 5NK40-0174]|uniref:outer membrane protein assembly factor BamC n=1 Tax=Hydrogenophaga sp. 5NK40-0174 TaxID=3127649 RepID=UPI003103FC8C
MSKRPVFAGRSRNLVSLAVVTAVAGGLAGCTILEEDRIDYKSTSTGRSLEVPPDLTQLQRDSRYAMPGDNVTASSMPQTGATVQDTGVTAATQIGDVRIERAGNQRWLVISRPADELWTPVRQFWLDNGFTFTREDQRLGIMETDWAENRAKIPQDVIRRTIGKVFDSLYDTGERDRFRTRIERSSEGQTEIYISHRGMEEVYTSSRQDNTIWQPRASDPELETEFLRRLMIRLGVSEEKASAVAADSSAPKQSTLVTVDGQQAIRIEEGFDRAWRRVGLSLDRTGFTVEDRDRTKGVYFVRFVPALSAEERAKPSLLRRMFGAEAKEAKPEQYQVVVRSDAQQSLVTVLSQSGKAESAENAKRILTLLSEDLR